MRALISLYHQADTFITPENLSRRIDDALTNNQHNSSFYTPTTTIQDLKNLVNDRRNLPKFTEHDDSHPMPRGSNYGTMGPDWEESEALREQRVSEALYGVDADGKPGLESLEEAAERIQQNLAEELTKRSS
jgi:hypothetical protein